MSLSPRSVLITGANRGLGLEFVRQMLELPTPPTVIIACCRNPKSASDLQSLSKNSSLHIVKLDVTNDDDIQQAFKVTETLLGDHGLTLLINNAGIFENKSDGGRIHLMTRHRMNKHYEINVTSQIMITKTFLPLLRRAADQVQTIHPHQKGLSVNKSAIVMIGSGLSSQTNALDFPDYSKDNMDYRCAKTALHMAVVLLSRDLKESGILVMAVHPGWVRTQMGGDQGMLAPEESIKSVLGVLSQANEMNHGHLTDYTGKVLPY